MIGLLGGFGNIGSKVLTLLCDTLPNQTIKVGSRSIDSHTVPRGLKENVVCEKVDIFLESSIERFFKDCDIVINCAGSSYESTPILIDMAIKKGCHLVDVGLCNVDTSKYGHCDYAIVYGAGSVPGLSGIIPLLYGKGFKRVEGIISIYEIKDTFTHTASRDYLNGIMNSKNDIMYVYKDKNSYFNQNKAYDRISIPTFGNPVRLFPYYDEEAEYVAKRLDVQNSEWYSAISGENNLKLLGKLSILYRKSIDSAIDGLCNATSKDVEADRKYVQYLTQISGLGADSRKKVISVSLKGQSQSSLTGAVAVSQALSILDGNVHKGVYPLYKSKYIEDIFSILKTLNAIESHTVYSSDIDSIQIKEEVF